MYPNEADRYAIRIQTFAIPDATRLRNDNQQSARPIVMEELCFPHGQIYVACSCVEKPSDLFVYAPFGKTKNIVYTTALQ